MNIGWWVGVSRTDWVPLLVIVGVLGPGLLIGTLNAWADSEWGISKGSGRDLGV